jgi:Flp pilus assembly protein TadB/Mg-chelatase subunit ChlD
MNGARRFVTVALRVLAGCGVAATAAVPGPVQAAPAEPVAVVVSGVQPSIGAVEFFVAARGLPAGRTLSGARVTVTADGTLLPATVRTMPTTGGSGARSAVVLVIDTSGSMAGEKLAAARAAALDYAAAAPPGVLLGLVTVADSPTVVLSPTTDRAGFTAAVERLTAGGGTALYDGVQAAVDLLDPASRPAAAGLVERRMMVLSDGADTASTMTSDRLTRVLKRSAVLIDVVALGSETDRAVLSGLSGAAGGRVLAVADAGSLRSAFLDLAVTLSAPMVVTATVPPALAGRTTSMSVSVTAGTVTARTELAVVFRPDPAAAPAPTPFTAPAAGGPGLVAVVALVLAALLAVCFVALPRAAGRAHLQRRLLELDRFTGRGAAVSAGPAESGSVLRAAALAVSERAVARPGRRERIELALDRAGLHLRASEWQLIQAGAAAGGAVSLAIVLPWWCGLPVGLLAGWFGAGTYLRLRAGRRTRTFAEQLPDALQLVVGSLRAGFSLPQSIDALVREGSEPVAGELGRALAETRLGGSLEDSLDRVGQRNASQDITWLVMAIRIQREVGGNLSEVLETAVGTMRERARLGRHVRALSAEGRLSALILLAMPIVLGGWMFAFRREYLEPLYTQPLGIAMLVTSVLMIGVGGLWLRKIVEVRV